MVTVCPAAAMAPVPATKSVVEKTMNCEGVVGLAELLQLANETRAATATTLAIARDTTWTFIWTPRSSASWRFDPTP